MSDHRVGKWQTTSLLYNGKLFAAWSTWTIQSTLKSYTEKEKKKKTEENTARIKTYPIVRCRMWSGTFFTAQKNVFSWNFYWKDFLVARCNPLKLGEKSGAVLWLLEACQFQVPGLIQTCVWSAFIKVGEVILISDSSSFSWKFS